MVILWIMLALLMMFWSSIRYAADHRQFSSRSANRLHAGQLRRCLQPRPAYPGCDQHALDGKFCIADCCRDGGALAWAVSRTDMPGRDWAHASVIAAFIIPTFLGAIGWMLLAGPNAGWLNRIVVGVFGAATGPFNIFSFSGLCFVIGIYAFP